MRENYHWRARQVLHMLLLLAFLILMNGLAVMLRNRFERRW